LRGYSDAFVTAIDKALAVRPQDRTQSIEEFRAQIGLGQTMSPSSTSAQKPAVGAGMDVQRPSPALAPRFLIPALGLAAAALAVGGWALWSRNAGDTSPSPALASPAASSTTPEQERAAPSTQRPDTGEAVKRQALDSSQRLAAVTTDLRELAKTENRDISPLLSALSERQTSAQAAASVGNLDEAIAANAEGATLAERELKKMIDDLVRRYGDLADEATAAKQLEIAQLARDRAKKVAAIGAKYRQLP
jgi:hypothetical protein